MHFFLEIQVIWSFEIWSKSRKYAENNVFHLVDLEVYVLLIYETKFYWNACYKKTNDQGFCIS